MNIENIDGLKITEAEITEKGISSLPTRPNAPVASGGGGFTPSALRARFDALPKLIAGRFNDFLEMVPNLAEYILAPKDDDDSLSQSTLADYLKEYKSNYDALEGLLDFEDEQRSKDERQDERSNEISAELREHSLAIERNRLKFEEIAKRVLLVCEIEHRYRSRITADGSNIYDEQNTFVKRIEGASALPNLIPYPYIDRGTITRRGITFTDLGDGQVKVVGTCEGDTAVFNLNLNIPLLDGVTYSLKNYSKYSNTYLYLIMGFLDENGVTRWFGGVYGATITWKKEYQITSFALAVHLNSTVNTVIRPMLYKETDVNFEGLQNAKINRIVSTGRNLFDYEAALSSIGFTKQSNGYWFGNSPEDTIVYENKGRMAGSLKMSYNGKPIDNTDLQTPFTFKVFYTDGTRSYPAPMNQGATDYATYSGSSDASKIVDYVVLSRGGGSANTFEIKDIVLSWVGYEEYEPYTSDIYQLPETVELGEYDYIDVAEGKIYRHTQMLDPTTANIQYGLTNSGDNAFLVWLTIPAYTDFEYGGFGVSTDFELIRAENLPFAGSFCVDSNVMIFSSPREDIESFRTKLATGKTIYRTAEPIAVEEIVLPEWYKAWNGGTETIFGADDATNEHAHPMIIQEYIVKEE